MLSIHFLLRSYLHYNVLFLKLIFNLKQRSTINPFTLVRTLQKNRPVPAFFFPAFLRTAVIDKPVPAFFENAGIGNPITAAQNQRFKKRCNRRPITAFLKNAGIGGPKALG